MNRADLISRIAKDAEITKAQADKALSAVVNGIKESLSESERVTLVGFGTFALSERQARKGRHPQTGNEIDIPASKTVKFKAGKELKGALS
jgi:DNA-binding protein HU-beta